MPKMQIPVDPEKAKPEGMPAVQEETRPLGLQKNGGYGLAYQRTDVTFVPLERIYINLRNPRYRALGNDYESQKAALQELIELSEIRSLRKSIIKVGLQKPLEVVAYREGYRVLDGNRRRAALHLVALETNLFGRVPVQILPDMNQEEESNYLLHIHGVSQAKAWSPIAKWEIPWKYHYILKYSMKDISEMTGIPLGTLKRYLPGIDFYNNYVKWLEQNNIEDKASHRRSSIFVRLLQHAPAWLKENPERAYKLIAAGKIGGSGEQLSLLNRIVSTPRLYQVLENEGLMAAVMSIRSESK